MQHGVIEAFCEGKFRDDRNEDRLHIGSHHIAVVDGSSASQPLGGRAGGIVAAETIVAVLEGLAPNATITECEGLAQSALSDLGRHYRVASPYAAMVVLSLPRREIWRIGDCPFAIDGTWNIPAHNPHEKAFFHFRQMMAAGIRLNVHDASLQQMLDASLSSVTREWLTMTKRWVNDLDTPFAFAACDERPAPTQFREVHLLPAEASSVVLASDGAVVSRNGQCGPDSVADMLEQIAAVRASDPLCLTEFPYWRGFLDGASYLDDTTLISIEL